MTAILRHHYVLAMHDIHKTAKIYTEVLGFEIASEFEGWIFVQKDQCLIMLGKCPDNLPAGEVGCHSYFA